MATIFQAIREIHDKDFPTFDDQAELISLIIQLNDSILEKLPPFACNSNQPALSLIFSNRFRNPLHSRSILLPSSLPVRDLRNVLGKLVVWLNPHAKERIRVGKVSETTAVEFLRDEDSEPMDPNASIGTYNFEGDDILSVVFDFVL